MIPSKEPICGPNYELGLWSRRNIEAFLEDQLSRKAPDTKSYCYSTDEERYHGNFSTEEEAIAEASAEGRGFWLGEVDYPSDFLSPYFVGDGIVDNLTELLHDQVGEVAECFTMTDEQKIEVGKVVIAMIDASPGFHCFGVKNIRWIDPK